MKTAKLDKANYGAGLAMVGGILVGAIVSNLAIKAVHNPTSTNSILSKGLMAKRGVIVVGGTVGGSVIESTDNQSLFLKSACFGAAGNQALAITSDLVATKVVDNGTKKNSLIRSAVGLACAADNQAQLWGARKRKRPGMKGLNVYIPNANEAQQKPRVVNSY